MSWSFEAVGAPGRVVEALEGHSEKISGKPEHQSRREFDEAKPHLIALVKQNFVVEGTGFQKPAIRISASGSASHRNGEKQQSQCKVTIEPVYGWVG